MKKYMRSLLSLATALGLCASMAACSSDAAKPADPAPAQNSSAPAAPADSSGSGELVRFTIGTAGTAGALYPMGVAMAETISKHVDGFSATGEATAASVENLRNLHDGKLGWAISQTEIASMAYYGINDYKDNAYTDIRALFGTIYSYMQIFVPADSPIQSVADFEGKTIGVGAAGSGGEMASRVLLDSYGLSYEDINPQFMPESEAVSALKDGKIDGFIATHPLKSAAMVDLTTSAKVRLLSVENEKFYEAIPAYFQYTVEPGTYDGIDEAVVIPCSRVLMCTSTNAGFSDEAIYNMVKAVWENRDEWASCNASVGAQALLDDVLKGIDIPMHPGAIQYFEEKGFTIPDNLKPQG